MARKTQGTAEALEEIQSAADKLGQWIQEHLVVVVGAVAVVLVLAGVGSYLYTRADAREGSASLALAEARTEYLTAMGASPGAIEVPELANPAAAERIRNEYRERFAEIADTYAGTVSGTLARLELAQLVQDGGDWEQALALHEQALSEAPPGDELRGLILQRIAQALEQQERWAEAAERHEQAAELADYPLRHWALADAARCRALAGDREAALALYRRLDSEAPDLRLPDHQRVWKRELEAAAAL